MKKPTDADAATPRIRPFAEFLRQTARGRTHDELSEKLHELVDAVRATGKGGKLQLTIDIKPVSKGDGHTLNITETVTSKLPSSDRPSSIFFVDGEGNLSRSDPRQMSLPISSVPSGAETDENQEVAQS